jgi:type VI secretion system secreted protein VgrG
VKVQFHWDRQGKNNADSSCWVRVAQVWAGKRWGAYFWPRIGQEVVVAFQEGDPDQPIIIGSVYNADQMPPYLGDGLDSKHKKDNKVTGVKSNTTMGGKGFNEWRFDDTKGKEEIFMHAERNMDVRVKHDSMERVIHDRHLIVGAEKDGNKSGDQREQVFQDKHMNIKRHQEEHIEGSMKLMIGHGDATDDPGNLDIVIEKTKKELIEKDDHLHVKGDQLGLVDGKQDLTVKGDKKELLKSNSHLHVKGNELIEVDGGQDITIKDHKKETIKADNDLHITSNRNEKVDGNQSLTVGQNQQEKVGMKHAVDAGQEIHLKAGMKVILEAGMQLTIKGPGGFVDIGPSGVTIQGIMVLINSGGAAGSGSGSSPTAPADAKTPEDAKEPEDAKQAKPIVPTKADNSVSGIKSAPG